MNVYRFVLILFFTLFFSISLVFSSVESSEIGTCCYDVNSGSVIPGDIPIGGGKYSCPDETTYIGDANYFSCTHYKPLFVKGEGDTCYGYDGSGINNDKYYAGQTDLSGKAIYASYQDDPSINIIRNILEGQGGNFIPTGSLTWYLNENCGDVLESESGIGVGSGSGSGYGSSEENSGEGNEGSNEENSGEGGENSNINPISNPYTPITEDFTPIAVNLPSDSFDVSPNIPISNIGEDSSTNYFKNIADCGLNSFSSFFDAESACNLIVSDVSSEQKCFYNPIGLDFLIFDINSQTLGSDVCVPKASISSCLDYNTQSACNSNAAYNLSGNYSSYHPNLASGCKWINSSSVNSFSSAARGVCVSNHVNAEDLAYEADSYSSRFNIINNPSFEEDLVGWVTSSVVEVVDNSYFGKNAVKLNSSASISQEIEDIFGKKYVLSFALLPEDLDNLNNFGINVSIIFKNSSGGVISTQILNHLKGLPGSEDLSVPLFKRIFFNSFIVPENTNSITLQINNLGSMAFYVDAVNLEEVTSATNLEYKSKLIVPEDASSCQSCFVEGSFNTCTQEKSNSLGACSYMVPDSSKAYGEDFVQNALGKNNAFTLLENKWKSQSLSTSKVFCELYQSKNKCVSHGFSSYVDYLNSLGEDGLLLSYFGASDTNPCKWSPDIGCFKNTFNKEDNTPDHLEMGDLIGGDLSYEYSCDLIAPEVYVDLFGIDENGDFKLYDGSKKLGNVHLHYQISDMSPDFLESCADLDVNSNLYFSYDVNYTNDLDEDIVLSRTFKLTADFGSAPLSHFLVLDSDNLVESLPVESVSYSEDLFNYDINSINIKIFDQSGNVGYDEFIEANFDSSGPNVVLESHENTLNNGSLGVYKLEVPMIYSKNSVFNFSVSDESKIDFCSFGISGSNLNLAPDEMIPIPGSNNSYNFLVDLTRLVENPSPFGDIFTLLVKCYDIYGQEGFNKYINIHTNFNVDVTNLFPLPFPFDYDSLSQDDISNYNIGFMNTSQETIFFYTRHSGLNCSAKINGGNFSSFGLASNMSQDFIYGDINYSYIVSSEIDFQKSGVHTLELSCSGQNGVYGDNFTYIVDNLSPSLNSISLSEDAPTYVGSVGDNLNAEILLMGEDSDIGNSISFGTFPNFKFNSNLFDLIFNLRLNGSKSWINNSYSFDFCNYDNDDNVCNSTDESEKLYLFNDFSYITNTSSDQLYVSDINFSIPSSTSGNNFIIQKIGLNEIEENLYNVSFNFTFFDKAGNSKDHLHSFLVDNSTPGITLGGEDIGVVNKTKNLIFANSINPNFDLTFNAPSSRVYSCDVRVSEGNFVYSSKLGAEDTPNSSFSFKLSEITGTNVDISQQKYGLALNCVDNSGNPIFIDELFLVYDDLVPKIVSIGFESGNEFTRYLPSDNVRLSEVVSGLNVVLNKTEDYGLSCNYYIEPIETEISEDGHYICNASNKIKNSFSFMPGYKSLTHEINLFSPDSKNDLNNDSYFCSTTSDFWNDMHYYKKNYFTLNLNCSDMAGNSVIRNLDFSVSHSEDSLSNIEFRYDKERAYPNFYFLNSYNGGLDVEFLYSIGESLVSLKNMTLPDTINANTWVNSTTSYINLSKINLEDGDGYAYIVVRYSSSSTTTWIKKDTTAPVLELNVSDLIDGILHHKSTQIKFRYDDDISNIVSANIYVRDLIDGEEELIYNLSGALNSKFSKNFSSIENDLTTMVISNLDPSNYSITLIAKDSSGFESNKSINFTDVSPGIFLSGNRIFNDVLDSSIHYSDISNPNITLSSLSLSPLNCSSGFASPIINNVALSNPMYSLEINSSNSFIIPSALSFGSIYDQLSLSFSCELENITMSPSFTLIYDNSDLTINTTSFVSNLESFNYPNKGGLVFNKFEDQLRVSFIEKKPYASCSLTFVNNSDYSCNNTPITFSGSGNSILSENLFILGGQPSQNSLCNYNHDLGGDGDKFTSLNLSVSCLDGLDNSDSENFIFNVDYVDDSLLNVYSSVDAPELSLSVDSLELTEEYSFNLSLLGNVSALSIDSTSSSSEAGGIFRYNLSKVDVSNLTSGNYYRGYLSLLRNGVEVERKEFSFYYFVSPEIFLSGNRIFNDVLDSSIYYTDISNSNIALSSLSLSPLNCSSGFATPILGSGLSSSSSYLIEINSSNSFIIPSALSFGSIYDQLSLSFSCELENITMSPSFTLIYDNSDLTINTTSFVSNLESFNYPNKGGLVFNKFEDQLRVSFIEKKPYASCSLTFVNNSDYSCNNTPITFSGSGNSILSENLFILGGQPSQNSLCNYNHDLGGDGDKFTSLNLSVSCLDGLDNSDSENFIFNVDYVDDSLLNVYSSVDAPELSLSVDSLELTEEYSFNLSLLGNVSALSIDSTSSSSEAGGIFRYNLSKVDVSNLTSGNYYRGYLSLLRNGVEVERKEFSFNYDSVAPINAFNILDFNVNNTIYSEDFNFNILVEDSLSRIDTLSILINDLIIFSKNSSGGIFTNGSYLKLEKSLFSDGNKLSYNLKYVGGFDLEDDISFTIESIDSHGNLNVTSHRVSLSGESLFTLLDSGDAHAHSSNNYWLTTKESPTLKFLSTTKFSKCFIFGGTLFENTNGLTYESNFSNYDKKLSGVNNLLRINCFMGSEITEFSKNVFVVDTLPDFVVNSEDNFLISEDIGLRNFSIESVVPSYIADLSCSYSFNEGESILISNSSYLKNHVFGVNFSSLDSDTYSLDISCTDLLNRTHVIEKEVVVNQKDPLNLSNFKLSSTQGEVELDLSNNLDNVVDISKEYLLSFNSNKKGIGCSYEIEESGFFNSIINFISSLFVSNYQDLDSMKPYSFESNTFNFSEEGDYSLSIVCSDTEENFYSSSFDILAENVDYDFSEIEINYN